MSTTEHAAAFKHPLQISFFRPIVFEEGKENDDKRNSKKGTCKVVQVLQRVC